MERAEGGEEREIDAMDIDGDTPEPIVVLSPKKKKLLAPSVGSSPQEQLMHWQDSIDIFSLFFKRDASRAVKRGASRKGADGTPLWLTLSKGAPHVALNETAKRRFYLVSKSPPPTAPTSSKGNEASTNSSIPVVFASAHSAFRYALSIDDSDVDVDVKAYCTGPLIQVEGNATMMSADGTPPPDGVTLDFERPRAGSNADVLQQELENIIATFSIPPGFEGFSNDPTAKIRLIHESSKKEYRPHWRIRIPYQLRKRTRFASLKGSLGSFTRAVQRGQLLHIRRLGKGPSVHAEVPIPITQVSRAYTSDIAFRVLCDESVRVVLQHSPIQPVIDTTTLPNSDVTPIGDVMTARHIEQYDVANILSDHPLKRANGSRSLRYLLARSLGESEKRTFFVVHKPREANHLRGAAEFNHEALDSSFERVELDKLSSAANLDPFAYLSFHSNATSIFTLSVGDLFTSPTMDDPTVHLDVVRHLTRLGRAFGAYVDKSNTKLIIMGQALSMHDFYDAVSLNASDVKSDDLKPFKVLSFGREKTPASLSAISTDVYFEKFNTFSIGEPDSIESELLDIQDEPSEDFDKPLFNEKVDTSDNEGVENEDDDDPFGDAMDFAYAPEHFASPLRHSSDEGGDSHQSPKQKEKKPMREKDASTKETRGKKRPIDTLEALNAEIDAESASGSASSSSSPDDMDIDDWPRTVRSISTRGFGSLPRIADTKKVDDINEIILIIQEHERGPNTSPEQARKRARLQDQVRPVPPPSPPRQEPIEEKEEAKKAEPSYEYDFDD